MNLNYIEKNKDKFDQVKKPLFKLSILESKEKGKIDNNISSHENNEDKKLIINEYIEKFDNSKKIFIDKSLDAEIKIFKISDIIKIYMFPLNYNSYNADDFFMINTFFIISIIRKNI